MNICEVGDKLVSGVGGGKAIGIGGELRVVALVCKERSGSGGRTFRIIVCEFCDGEPVRPVILLIITVDAEILFHTGPKDLYISSYR